MNPPVWDKIKPRVVIERSVRVEQLNADGWAMTYLLVCKSTGKAALIDPVWDNLSSYETALEGLELVYSIATHTHADHITGCFSLVDKGCEYVMHKDSPCLGVTRHVADGDTIQLGELEISFHHVPGHTADSLIVEVTGHIFTGDFLFTGGGGVGRDDLPGGRIDEHWDSLAVLRRFSGDVLVCSGHDPPGTQMQSLAWNRENNPILSMTFPEHYRQWQETTTAGLGSVSKIKTALPANIFAEIPEHVPWLD
jgi:glyoxylase-like metal-dependent hydrolase (beta-lactamase superfamily II)